MSIKHSRVLIAGCGDLGLRTARLLRQSDDVEAVFGLRRSPPDTAVDDVQWVRGDVADKNSLSALPPGVTHVLYSLTPGGRTEDAYRRVFVDGLKNLVSMLAPQTLQRIVFVSSSAVYGDHHGQWIDEDTPEAPLGFNGRILLEGERWLHSQGLSATTLRLAGIYGPGRTQLLDRIRMGEARAPSHPPHWANRIHIDDAARACARLLTAEQIRPCYLGCDDTPLPLDKLYAELAKMLGAPAPAEGVAPPNVGSKRMRNTRLRATGWTPSFSNAIDGYSELI